ncbi:MAG TPA: MFS transporter, partial [Clostridia bacterium]
LLFIVFQEDFGISFEMIGRLILINFSVQIAADFFAVKYVDRIGYRAAAVAAHIFSAAGLIALGVLPRLLPTPYVGIVIAVVVYAIGGGLIEVLISPIVESLPGEAKASAMSLLHSFYCWGQMGVVLVTTAFIKILGADIWFLLPILWSLVPIFNLFRFLKVPLMPAIPDEHKTPVRQLLNSRVFLTAMLLMVCAGAAELTMSQWSSLFAEKGLHVPKFVGDLLGPCLFAVLMGTGRTLYGVWGHKINLKKALLASGILCVACYAVTVFVQIPIVSLLGCALCGLSVSLMWPGTFSLSAASHPMGGTAMFGILAIFGDIGGAVGPWLVGLFSDLSQKSARLVALGSSYGLSAEQVGLKTGLLIAMVFPVALVVGILRLTRKGRRNKA